MAILRTNVLRLRFAFTAVLTPALSWVLGSAVPDEQQWLNFSVELLAMLIAVYLASLIARSATGWAVATGLGLTFGLASAVVLYFGVRGINACGGRGFSTPACPRAPTTAAIAILIQLAVAIALAFWLAARARRVSTSNNLQSALPSRPDRFTDV
jgi:hypothetical protein